MRYFKDGQNQVYAYTEEQLLMVAALNKAELTPVFPSYEHDAPEPQRPQFDAVVYAMRAKIGSMTEITEEEADELTRPPEPPRDERQEILNRIAEIEDEMSYLQDAVDLGMATVEEADRLLALKRERVELKRALAALG